MIKMLASLTLLLAATGAAAQIPPPEGTIVNDRAALQRLRRNSGITLQWISFETSRRGHVVATMRGGLLHLSGSQAERGGPGRLTLDGDVLRVDPHSFTFQGRIVIAGAPDPSRNCVRDGTYEFRVTQRRRYWRLQDFEACDGLADYVDIYF
ncbi:MAG TPA: hypothetical protein VGO55_14030 [Allosphingosinicella sp.]|jgi:hypothetical protein|nr:hypothetical protein [Allosphingosinicella sp.]